MRSDLSTIIGSMIIFITFLISLSILNYFITLNSEKTLMIFEDKINFYYEKSLELIDFLNNQTNSSNPILVIKNVGKISLDLSCFKLYFNGNLTNFTYTIDEKIYDTLLNPGETANITLPMDSQGWKKIELVSCRGNRFETLIYYI